MIQLPVRSPLMGGITRHRTPGLRSAVLLAACGNSLWAQTGGANPSTAGRYQPLDSTGRWQQYLDDTSVN